MIMVKVHLNGRPNTGLQAPGRPLCLQASVGKAYSAFLVPKTAVACELLNTSNIFRLIETLETLETMKKYLQLLTMVTDTDKTGYEEHHPETQWMPLDGRKCTR